MLQGFSKEVHLIPLGHEIDRVVIPFKDHKPDVVYLLAVNDTFNGKYETHMIEAQRYFTKSVETILQNYGIEVKIKTVDIFEEAELAEHLSHIIVKEKSSGNTLFVNMSSGNKLSSGVSSIVAMAHDIHAYYVMADGYSVTETEKRKHGLSICNQCRLHWISNLPISLPKAAQMSVLVEVAKAKNGLKTIDILEFLGKDGEPTFEECVQIRSRSFGRGFSKAEDRGKRINYLMRLNKGILSKLESDGYVFRKQIGKYNTINITPKGLFAAHVSGLMPIVGA
jgi:hypothetical protein